MAVHATALQYIGLMALGFGVSSYGTLIGAGGGFVLMPVLLLLYPHENAHELTAISLAVVLINTLSGTAAYARMKRIEYKSGLLFAAATLPGAIAGVLTTAAVSRRFFEGLFSLFLTGLALFMLVRPKSDSAGKRRGDASHSPPGISRSSVAVDGIVFEYEYNRLLGMALFLFLGFVASFLGIGGGSLMVPLFIYVLNFPVAIATATSQLIVAILTFTSTLVHVFLGSFHHGAHRIAAIGIGMLLGAQLGAYLSNKIKGKWIIRSLAVALALVGIRMLLALFW
jgi:uncharacterized membrane protein YfcA